MALKLPESTYKSTRLGPNLCMAHVRSLAEGDFPTAHIILLKFKLKTIFMAEVGFEPGSTE